MWPAEPEDICATELGRTRQYRITLPQRCGRARKWPRSVGSGHTGFPVSTGNPRNRPSPRRPHGFTTIVDKMDMRPGGEWRFIHKTPNGDTAFRGVYREIVPPERLVYTFEWEGLPGHISTETVTFVEQDGKTTLINRARFDSVEDRDGMLRSGMEKGATETMDRLAALLAEV